MLEKYGVQANELRIVGGGSKNPLWRRIIADAFQVRATALYCPVDNNSTHDEAPQARATGCAVCTCAAMWLCVRASGHSPLPSSLQLPLRFPEEPESAALGGALQAAAVCAGVPVAEYVADNEPQCEAEVRVGQPLSTNTLF